MAKKLRKNPVCYNCNYAFKEAEVDNFCLQCGQENTNKVVSFFTLVKDFFQTYFTIDSKFIRTIARLISAPGFLTNQYNSGKRSPYILPIRLYFIISILYFSLFTAKLSDWGVMDNINNEGSVGMKVEKAIEEKLPLDSILLIVEERIEKIESYEQATDTLIELPNLEINFSPESKVNLSDHKMDLRKVLFLAEQYDKEKVMDLLEKEGNYFAHNEFWRITTRQGLKIYKNGQKDWLTYMMGSLPLMMFFLMPICALIFKFLYLFSKRHYVEHLVFFFHLHAFIYLALIGILFLVKPFPTVAPVVLGTSIYLYFLWSMRTVYKQGKIFTFVKNFLFLILYPIGFTLMILLTAFLSFFLF